MTISLVGQLVAVSRALRWAGAVEHGVPPDSFSGRPGRSALPSSWTLTLSASGAIFWPRSRSRTNPRPESGELNPQEDSRRVGGYQRAPQATRTPFLNQRTASSRRSSWLRDGDRAP